MRAAGALSRRAPEVRLTGLAARYHTMARLPDSADERQVVEAARQRSVGLYSMSPERASGAAVPPQLVLGFGNVSERAIESGSRRRRPAPLNVGAMVPRTVR